MGMINATLNDKVGNTLKEQPSPSDRRLNSSDDLEVSAYLEIAQENRGQSTVRNIKSIDYKKLWGKMTKKNVKEFDNYIKSIPHGKEGRDSTKEERTALKDKISCKDALMVIHPKVDSKNQRRVQCSFKIDEMIAAGVEYFKKDMNIKIKSSARTFNK